VLSSMTRVAKSTSSCAKGSGPSARPVSRARRYTREGTVRSAATSDGRPDGGATLGMLGGLSEALGALPRESSGVALTGGTITTGSGAAGATTGGSMAAAAGFFLRFLAACPSTSRRASFSAITSSLQSA
jgi:hypothetical protein